MALGLALLGLALAGVGCRNVEPRPAPAPADPRLSLGPPSAVPRVGAAGAPVDCTIEVTNRSGQLLSRAVLSCELLDAEGVQVGAGLGSLQNVPNGERRSLRTVVYGVRNFASARARVASADFR